MARGQLPKAYLRIDPNLDQHPEAEGMLFLICAAARQARRGYFTRAVVDRILGRKRADRFVAPRGQGKTPDLIEVEDGSLYLAGWDEWNEGDLTVGERMKRVRDRRAGYSRNEDVTQPFPGRDSDVSVTQKRKKVAKKEKIGVQAARQQGSKAGTEESGADAPAPARAWSREACDDWIERFQGTAPGGKIGKALEVLVSRHTWADVRVAWRFYLAQAEAEWADPFRFANTYGKWITASRGTDAAPAAATRPRQLVEQTQPATSEQIRAAQEAGLKGGA